jgi:membrane fusion protein (multidrug efflux system)
MIARMNDDSNSNKNSRMLATAAFAVSVLVLCGGGYLYWTGDRVSTDDAFVDGHIFSVTPRVGGYVTDVFATDNEAVKRGQRLLALDRTEYEVALAEAKANLAEAGATLTSLELGVPLELSQTAQKVRGAEAELSSLHKTLEMRLKDEEAASQELRRASAEHDKSLLDLRRMKELIKSHAISQAALDDVETKSETSRAHMRAVEARLEGVRRQIAALKSDMERLEANIKLAATGEDQAKIRARLVEAQRARVDLARSRVRQAELNLEYTTITSPADGHVTRKRVEPGLMIAKGQPLMAVVPLHRENLWITANFKETQLTRVQPGQRVSIAADAYPGIKLEGKVDSIMAGTGAIFSLFPPENATGNYVKVVQRVPVKIAINGQDAPTPLCLRIGMSVVPTIYTGD